MGLNPLFSLKVEHVRWHSGKESASDGAHVVVIRSSVNGSRHPLFGLLLLGVSEPGQAEAVAKKPARKHQRRHGGEAAREPDPDSDALPVSSERKPGADAEAYDPIADAGEEQGPARIVQAAEHASADHLRAVHQ